MASEEKNIITLPVAFFLDTNILDALPESLESGELNSLVSEVGQVRSRVYLPDVVAREWLKHRVDKVVKSYLNVRKGSKHLRSYISTIPDFELEDKAIIDAVFSSGIQRMKAGRLRILRPPLIDTRSMTLNAVCEVAPFTHSNKGFKDELVVLSMLDVIGRGTFKSCVLVTADKDFAEKDIQPRFKLFNVEFRVVNNLQKATQLIVDTLNEAGQKYYEHVCRSAFEYAKTHWKEISSSIIKKINLDGVSEFRLTDGGRYSVLDGTLKRVVRVNPLEIKGAIPGVPEKTEASLTPITISVDVELELEYEQMEFNWADIFGKKIKTTDEKREFKPIPYILVVKTKTFSASVEATAKLVKDKWEEFKIIEVRV